MAKQGEVEYLSRAGPQFVEHARGKPYSDAQCGAMLSDLGGVLMLLPSPPARLLDLGCGSGWTSTLLARRGYEVVGQDIAPDMITLAESTAHEEATRPPRFVVSDYESLAFLEEFDAALFYDSLHHAVDPHAAMASAFRALKPGGILVTLEPGAGHAASEAARNAIAAFDVTERDMPPRLVGALGREIGFREVVVYPMPKALAQLQYQSRPPRGWPRALAPLHQWLAIGWLSLAVRGSHGGLVVLRK